MRLWWKFYDWIFGVLWRRKMRREYGDPNLPRNVVREYETFKRVIPGE